ncbi:proteasome subunit alpha type-7-like [Teleopsis dalmanni]|uniref:proteasome subunit alpha type-7-like n=1 Tax=Teleopsis dalmanni TaxID=139649 RepID=UPI0018CF95C5|nr:proteasome subunit alpha type-7-like [Teleopsis dalmanni]
MLASSVSAFASDGRLLQVEAAQEATRKGSTAVGIRGSNFLILGVHNRVLNKTIVPRTVSKMHALDSHLVMVYVGIVGDAMRLREVGIEVCKNNKQVYDNNIEPYVLAKYIADLKQNHTCLSTARPFGVSCIFAGFDHDYPQLLKTDPSGEFNLWKACAIGQLADSVEDFLAKNLTNRIAASVSSSIKLAANSLFTLTPDSFENIEIGIMIKDKPLEMISNENLHALLQEESWT